MLRGGGGGGGGWRQKGLTVRLLNVGDLLTGAGFHLGNLAWR